MNEYVKRLVDSIKANDEAAGIDAAAEIASVLLNDLHRVADALEAIAKSQAAVASPVLS